MRGEKENKGLLYFIVILYGLAGYFYQYLSSLSSYLLSFYLLSESEMEEVNAKYRELLRTAKRVTFKKVLKRIIRMIYSKHVVYQYRLFLDETYSQEGEDRGFNEGLSRAQERVFSPNINVQRYDDILRYTGSNPWHPREAFILEAKKRFGLGDILYSICDDGILVHYGWMTKGGRRHTLSCINMSFNSPVNSIILYDFYTEPAFRGRGFYKRNLRKMISDGFNLGVKDIYISAEHDNHVSRRAIESVGFKPYRCFNKLRFLFWSKKLVTAIK
ncbi:MAG: GNAT family N-acetyltransferase [bacterium]